MPAALQRAPSTSPAQRTAYSPRREVAEQPLIGGVPVASGILHGLHGAEDDAAFSDIAFEQEREHRNGYRLVVGETRLAAPGSA